MKIWKVRRDLYRTARILGDVSAVKRGPKAVGKRVARRVVGRATGRALGRLFR